MSDPNPKSEELLSLQNKLNDIAASIKRQEEEINALQKHLGSVNLTIAGLRSSSSLKHRLESDLMQTHYEIEERKDKLEEKKTEWEMIQARIDGLEMWLARKPSMAPPKTVTGRSGVSLRVARQSPQLRPSGGVAPLEVESEVAVEAFPQAKAKVGDTIHVKLPTSLLRPPQLPKSQFLTSQPAPASSFYTPSLPRDITTLPNLDPALQAILMTEASTIFAVDLHRGLFTSPLYVKGVPTKRITETGRYWLPSWDSLNTMLDKYTTMKREKEELTGESARVKAETRGRGIQALDEQTAKYAKNLGHRIKTITNELGSLRLINQYFGPQGSTGIHPNQLLSKSFMSSSGLCSSRTLGALSHRLQDLEQLKLHGELAMKPIEFLRWRVDLRAEESATSGKNATRSKCLAIASGNTPSTWADSDPVMTMVKERAAVLKSRLLAAREKRVRVEEEEEEKERKKQRVRH